MREGADKGAQLGGFRLLLRRRHALQLCSGAAALLANEVDVSLQRPYVALCCAEIPL